MSAVFDDDLNLTFVRGDDIEFRLELTHQNGSPMDLSNWSFLAQCRSKPGGYILFSFDIDTTLSADGVVRFYVPHTTTETIRLEAGVWDIQTTDATGFRRTIGPADVTIIKDVSL